MILRTYETIRKLFADDTVVCRIVLIGARVLWTAQLALKSAKSVVTPDIDPKRNVKISRSLSKPKVTTINGGPKTARHVAASTKLRTGKVR